MDMESDPAQAWSPTLGSAVERLRDYECNDKVWVAGLLLSYDQEAAVLERLRSRSAEWILLHFEKLVEVDVMHQDNLEKS